MEQPADFRGDCGLFPNRFATQGTFKFGCEFGPQTGGE